MLSSNRLRADHEPLIELPARYASIASATSFEAIFGHGLARTNTDPGSGPLKSTAHTKWLLSVRCARI
jgi:hypothetical protein